jgi:hypothetical protein
MSGMFCVGYTKGLSSTCPCGLKWGNNIICALFFMARVEELKVWSKRGQCTLASFHKVLFFYVFQAKFTFL